MQTTPIHTSIKMKSACFVGGIVIIIVVIVVIIVIFIFIVVVIIVIASSTSLYVTAIHMGVGTPETTCTTTASSIIVWLTR